ncbi:MAG: YeaH/YhbH family protein [Sedimenticola sp.]|nr:YeaH/YhbH family protein [Sedimenticola sp.]
MAMIIDRRLDGRNKSAVNRQRLLRRYKQQIKKSVSDAINKRSITDTQSGEKINIPAKDVTEPVIHHGSGGIHEHIHPGNKEFSEGDEVRRPDQSAQGGGGSKASNSGDGEDEFGFEISKDEYLDLLFEELALPNLVKTKVVAQSAHTLVRAGFSNTGVASNLNLARTMRRAKGRKIAIASPYSKRCRELEEMLEQELERKPHNEEKIGRLRDELSVLRARIDAIPFIDTYDLKFNQFVPEPKPITQAVMFCIMDVSGSMSQATKDIAKRFFILLYLFLSRSYEKTEVVFIRHHTSAKEVDEEEFFYSRETGGTIVSSALKLMRDIIRDRYPTEDWNIYAAQASDGDNWEDDSATCRDLMFSSIMPYLQYYAYVEIHNQEHQGLWREYEKVDQAFGTFSMKQIRNVEEIYPVFHELFRKEEA